MERKSIPPKVLFMLVLYPGRIDIWRVKNLRAWRKNPWNKARTNNKRIYGIGPESNPDHTRGRRGLSPLHHFCSHVDLCTFVHPCATIISYLSLGDDHLKIKVSSSRIAINVEKILVEPKAEEESVDLGC